MTKPLKSLINIGPKLQKYCEEIGIHTADDFFAAGYMQVFLAVAERHKHMHHRMALYAFYGACRNINCMKLPQEIKDSLETELQAALKKQPSHALHRSLLAELP